MRTSTPSRRSLLTAAALVPLSSLLAPRSSVNAQERVNLALDWYPNGNHAGLFLAEARGYFAAAGLAVEIATPADPTTVLQTVGAGRDTLGISYQPDVLLARARGVPVVSVAALVQQPLLGVMSLASAGITRPADLVGKTVGYPGIASQEAFLATMLEADGASLADVELVNVDFNLLPSLLSGRATAVMGAYWTHETIIAERQGYPVSLLRVEEWGVPSYYELVLVTSEETAADRGDTVKAFLGATQRGYVEAARDVSSAVETLAAAYPETDRPVEEAGIALLAELWASATPVFGAQTVEQWTSFAGWMVERGLLPADLDPLAAFMSDLLPVAAATPTASPRATPAG